MTTTRRPGRARLASLTSGPLAPSSRLARVVVSIAAASLLLTAGVVGLPASSATAASYPSWEDVQKARGDETAKQAEITNLEGILTQMQADLDAKNAEAEKRGDELQKAQSAYDDAQYKTTQLQSQADAADKVAAASEERAGQLAAQLGRSGGTNGVSGSLIADPGEAGQLLYKLGAMSKLTEQADGIYSQATQDRNTAQGLSDQAAVAEAALAVLADTAQKALADANDAAQAASDALAAQQENQARLQAQLETLKTNVDHTEAEYQKGVEESRAAAAAAAAATNGTALGVVSPQGWTRPAGGNISSGFGMRVNPVTHAYILHAGTDLAAGCNSPIYAATAGVVTYAGWYGGYGNFVLIDHGNGVTTGYGHQPNGGIMVSVGQAVGTGQQIGHVGSTGNSTGCHLHFETRVGGVAQNPQPFMADRGIRL
ncbi:M23 family metallopeptidase [Frigoribacterium sp. MCBA15_019]|uniref:M23 family metallopeptidase n=1 Tax=Frigoribacterium sp. MCBA15_019 TaxID=1898745 RepID=UPI00115F8FEB|nr:M23 family metallopeptidase [Frigoribacterium sp. MCBA15_019]